MRNFFLLAMLIGCAGAYFVFASHQNLRVVQNDVVISINAPNVRETSLSRLTMCFFKLHNADVDCEYDQRFL